MNVLDLFSGIGGFSLGLERAGMRTVAFCERDEFCRAVLRKHWPDVPCFDDIRAIDADGLARLGRIDLVCGGFPCQPFSVAGKQKAHADDRYLWPEMRRVIALARPPWIICENVAGIIPLALDDVLADLESIVYAARPFVIPAVAVDAKHRRDRVWIIASDTSSNGRKRGRPGKTERFRESGGLCHAPGSLADTERQRQQGPWASGNAGDTTPSCERQTTKSRNGGFRCLWSAEPDVGRVAHGIPARAHRLRALGNAVVPQVVEEIGRAIMRCAK